MNTGQQTLILNEAQLDARIRRMAYQILERHFEAPCLVLAGIAAQGDLLAARLERALLPIAKGQVARLTVRLDKQAATQPEVSLEGPLHMLSGQASVVLVDDVLNSGRTLSYAMAPFLARPLAGLSCAVLIERSYRLYPVSAEVSGLRLATTLEDHVEVTLEGKTLGAHLR